MSDVGQIKAKREAAAKATALKHPYRGHGL
jgi:hypothetical protein